MKKNKLFVLCASLLMIGSTALVACGGKKKPVTPEPTVPVPPTGLAYNQTVYFFLDYSHSDSEDPFYKMKWYSGYPLGSCPEECKLTNDNASDPLFPVFLGWSKFSSSLDDSKLWDFAKDYQTGSVLKLYGIWVAND